MYIATTDPSVPQLFNRASGGVVLKVPDEVTYTNVERRCDASKRVYGDGFFHTFHLANIFRIQFSRLPEVLLRHSRLLPVKANGLAESFPMCGTCCHKMAA